MIYEVTFVLMLDSEDEEVFLRLDKSVTVEPWEDDYVHYDGDIWIVVNKNWMLNKEGLLKPEFRCNPYKEEEREVDPRTRFNWNNIQEAVRND